MSQKTYQDFPEFYNHPFIQSIAGDELWTVSDKNKKPIDMWDLVLYNSDLHRPPAGARNHDNQCLMTLADVCKYLPSAPNNAYYFQAKKTGYMILDVEADCSDELKSIFLNTNYIYGEVSMSGKGYHLIYKIPDCLSKYPEAMKKVKMQDSERKFEFLMEHYVTFTRNLLPPAKPDALSIETYFEQLCAMQQNTDKKFDFNVEAEHPDDIHRYDVVMMIMRNGLAYKKTLDDFHGDNSRYEFGCAAMVYKRLERCLKQFHDHEYTQTEKAWLIYDLIVDLIPHRDKHDTMRDGMPWLLYIIREMMAKNADDPDMKDNHPDKPVYPAEE